MNFNDVYKKIAQIDGVLKESTVQECGEMPPAPMTNPKSPMSMTVNLNAQGEEDISSLMRLLTKVNPDMMPAGNDSPLPGIKSGPELAIGGPGPKVSSPADDIKNDMTKLLSLDEPEDEPEDESRYSSDEYGGEHDPDPEPKPKGKNPFPFADDEPEDDDSDQDEAYSNEPDVSVGDVSDMTHDGTDLNKSKGTYPKVAGGDNPMQRVKEELMARLAELKSQQ